MRKIGIDEAEVDATKILEETDDYLVVPATIAREGVFPYPEGQAYKPAKELQEAAWTAEGAWIVPEKHPDTLIVTHPNEVIGRVEKSFFCEKINGIQANLRFDKKRGNPEFIRDIKAGKRKDVSIGFFYDFDATPGEFQGKKYDFVQRNILIDHVAAGVPAGRCPSPYCGIAVDAIIRKPAGDPWEETEDYIRSGHKEPGETCRTITLSEDEGIKAVTCKYGDKWEIQSYLFSKAKNWTLAKAKAWFAEHKKAADSFIRKFTGDPFGEYKDFDDCVAKNQDKDDPEAYCAEIKRKIEGASKGPSPSKLDATAEIERAKQLLNYSHSI